MTKERDRKTEEKNERSTEVIEQSRERKGGVKNTEKV